MSVSVRNLLLVIVGIILGLFMATAPWLFGIEGDLIWWYLPLISLSFIVLHSWVVRRIHIAKDRGRPVGRSPYVALALSWACAIGFGLTVPERVNGELVSVMSHFAGAEWLGMSIALCNPFGIIAFTTASIALAFAIAAGRDPRPSEDDLLDAAGATAAGEVNMVPHPLSPNDSH